MGWECREAVFCLTGASGHLTNNWGKKMKFKPTPIASAVALALAGVTFGAQAQQQKPAVTETVTVTGIRASAEKSLETKKNSDAIVEVVTSEDIGKMPDKNVADA